MLRVVSVALVLTALWSAEAAVKGALNPSVAVVQQKAQTHVPPPPADPAPPPAGAEQLKTPPLTAPKAYVGVLKGRDRYARYCLNMFAPQELGLPDIYPEHDAFCKHFATEKSTVSLSEELRAAAKTPEPSQRESYIAELTAEAQAHGAGSSSSSSASASAASTAASSVSSDSAPSASSAPAQPSAHGASNGAQEFNADANGGRPLSLLEAGSNPASAAAKWPSRKIPYFVEDGLPDAVVIRLNWALNTFELRSCIVFVPTNKEKPWLPTEDPSLPAHRFRAVKSQDGSCSSATGMKTSGDQALHLGPKCNSGSILHALMHLLGFKHTVQRSDRDSYILWNELNTKPAFRKLYAKTNTPFKDYGRYDFSSIMHLGDGVQTLGDVDTAAAKGEAASFSVLSDPNKPNLAPKQPPTAGSSPALNAPWDGRAQRLFLSKGDVEGIHALYCPELPIPPSQLNEQALLHPKGVVLPKPSPTNKHPHLEPVECFHQAGDHDLYVQGKGDCVRHNFFWMCSPHPDCHNAKQTCGCGPSPKLGCDGQCFCQSNRWFNECRCMKPLDPKKQYCVNGSSPTALAKALF